MRKYITLFFSVLPFFIACNSSGVPDGIIPPGKMTAVMKDVYLTDGRMSAYQQLPDTLYKYGTARYLAIFKKYDTDSGQFRKSYVYYSSRPQQLLDMNVKILADLKTEADSLNAIERRHQLKKPSAAHTAGSPASPPPPSAGRPVSTFHPSQPPGAVPVGVQAPVEPPTRVIPGKSPKSFSGNMQRFRAKRDSILKAKLKQHAGSN